MNKIPVFKTLEDAYGFAFRKFFALLGICWFPFLLLGAAVYFMAIQAFGALPALAESGDPTGLLVMVPILLLLIPVAFLLMCIIMDGMTRLALDKMQPSFFSFSLAYPVWRLLIAMICVYLLLLGMTLVLSLLIGAVGAATVAAGGEIIAVIVAMLSSVVLAIVFVYVVVRLTFFLVPVTVAEGRRVVSRSWELSKGNSWRIVGILGGVFIPMMILQMIVQMILMVPVMMAMSQIPLPAEPLSPEEGLAFAMQLFQSMAPFLIILIPFVLAAYVLMYGLICGASAFAYRSLMGVEKTEEIFA